MLVVFCALDMQNGYNEIGFVQQILSLNLVPRKNGTNRGNDTSLSDFSGEIQSSYSLTVEQFSL